MTRIWLLLGGLVGVLVLMAALLGRRLSAARERQGRLHRAMREHARGPDPDRNR